MTDRESLVKAVLATGLDPAGTHGHHVLSTMLQHYRYIVPFNVEARRRDLSAQCLTSDHEAPNKQRPRFHLSSPMFVSSILVFINDHRLPSLKRNCFNLLSIALIKTP